MRAIRRAARALSPIEPPPQVWTQLQARLTLDAPVRPTLLERLGLSFIGWRTLQPLGAIAGLVLVVSSLAWVGTRLAVAPAPVAGGGGTMVEFQLAEAEYTDAIARLQEAADAAGPTLDALTNATLRSSIDRHRFRHRRRTRGAGAGARRHAVAGKPARRARQQGGAAPGHSDPRRGHRAGHRGTEPMKIAAGLAALLAAAIVAGAVPAESGQRGDIEKRREEIQRRREALRERQAELRRARQEARRGPMASQPFTAVAKIGRQGALTIVNAAGNVTITAGGGDDVRIDATKRVWDRTDAAARAALADVEIDVMERQGAVDVRTLLGRQRPLDAEVEYTIANQPARACRCARSRATS